MIDIRNLQIEYDGRNLFSPISLHVPTASIAVLMGSSGCGKSSILSAIGKFVHYTGNILCGATTTIFQDTNQLFPWFSIKKNLDLFCSNDYYSTVEQWNLTNLLDKKPNQLSGGQRQRFTLIRAVYRGNSVLLCDEPLSGLDYITRYAVLKDFKNIINERKLTVLYVTHDLLEAQYLTNNIHILSKNGIANVSESINEEDFIQQLGH